MRPAGFICVTISLIVSAQVMPRVTVICLEF